VNSKLLPKQDTLPPYPANWLRIFSLNFTDLGNTGITQAAQKKTCLREKTQSLRRLPPFSF
jgi:hypothetical protein